MCESEIQKTASMAHKNIIQFQSIWFGVPLLMPFFLTRIVQQSKKMVFVFSFSFSVECWIWTTFRFIISIYLRMRAVCVRFIRFVSFSSFSFRRLNTSSSICLIILLHLFVTDNEAFKRRRRKQKDHERTLMQSNQTKWSPLITLGSDSWLHCSIFCRRCSFRH